MNTIITVKNAEIAKETEQEESKEQKKREKEKKKSNLRKISSKKLNCKLIYLQNDYSICKIVYIFIF